MSNFLNHKPDKPYICFLYKKTNGEVKAKKFYGKEEAEKAIDKGWYTTPAVFADDVKDQVTEMELEGIKLAGDNMATDMNILANAMSNDDESDLRNTYRRVTGKDMDKRIKNLGAVQRACLKLLEKGK